MLRIVEITSSLKAIEQVSLAEQEKQESSHRHAAEQLRQLEAPG
jgi:hypothetical protein